MYGTMLGDEQAVAIWNQTPNAMRLRLLNNVYCASCSGEVGIGNATAVVEGGALLIKGRCVQCAKPVARIIEENINSNNLVSFIPNRFTRMRTIEKLIAYSKGGKFEQLLNNITPLQLRDMGSWIHSDYELFDKTDAVCREIYNDVVALGERTCWEIEPVLLDEYDEFDCPILHGIDLMNTIGFGAALKHFKALIKMEPRELDAYAHLGLMYFNLEGGGDVSRAKSYYKQGVAVGLTIIGKRINDVFPWGFIYNRPLLRCLHGFGLCLLEQGKTADAMAIFKQLLLLNPLDNQGIRFIISDRDNCINML